MSVVVHSRSTFIFFVLLCINIQLMFLQYGLCKTCHNGTLQFDNVSEKLLKKEKEMVFIDQVPFYLRNNQGIFIQNDRSNIHRSIDKISDDLVLILHICSIAMMVRS